MAAVVGSSAGDAVLQHEREVVAAVAGHVLTTARTDRIVEPLLRAVAVSNGADAATDAELIEGRAAHGDDARTLFANGWGIAPSEHEGLRRSGSPKTGSEIAAAMMASVELSQGYDPLVDLRARAGSSWRWSRGACGDSPHVRAMLAIAMREWCVGVAVTDAESSIDLLRAMNPKWYGQNAGFTALPVLGRRLSCAVRWHGARPALLWEFDEPLPPGVSVVSTRLDPEFRSTESSGEVLLNAPADPSNPAAQ